MGEEEKRTEIQKYFRTAIKMLKLHFLTLRPDDLSEMPLSQIHLTTVQRTSFLSDWNKHKSDFPCPQEMGEQREKLNMLSPHS